MRTTPPLVLAAALLTGGAATASAQWPAGPGPYGGMWGAEPWGGGPYAAGPQVLPPAYGGMTGGGFGYLGVGHGAPGPQFGAAYRRPFAAAVGPRGFGPAAGPWGPAPFPGFPPQSPTAASGGEAGAVFVPPGQSHIARPDPFGPPVRVEPRAKTATVGGITARRYDYSFDLSPLPAPAGVGGGLGGRFDGPAGLGGGATGAGW